MTLLLLGGQHLYTRWADQRVVENIKNSPGPKGTPGINCWDMNHNNECDAEEDVNGDLQCDAEDCKGADGVDCTDDGHCEVVFVPVEPCPGDDCVAEGTPEPPTPPKKAKRLKRTAKLPPLPKIRVDDTPASTPAVDVEVATFTPDGSKVTHFTAPPNAAGIIVVRTRTTYFPPRR